MPAATQRFIGRLDTVVGAQWGHELGAGTARPRAIRGDEPSPLWFMGSLSRRERRGIRLARGCVLR